MYDIQLNESGTRHLTITRENLQTLHKYNLLAGLENSTGYITENELDKLKLSIRALIANGSGEKTVAMADLFPKGVEDKKLTVEYTANPSWLMIQTLPYISTVDYKNAISLSTAYYANALGRYIMNQSPVIKQVVNIWKQEPADSDNSLMSALQRNQELKTLVLDETPWVMDADNEADQKRMLTTFFDESAMDYRLASQLKDLKDLQNSDGSWSWWRGMRGSASITAQVLQTLARLNVMAGYQKATAKMIENGMDYLRTVVMKEFEEMKRMEKKGQKPIFLAIY